MCVDSWLIGRKCPCVVEDFPCHVGFKLDGGVGSSRFRLASFPVVCQTWVRRYIGRFTYPTRQLIRLGSFWTHFKGPSIGYFRVYLPHRNNKETSRTGSLPFLYLSWQKEPHPPRSNLSRFLPLREGSLVTKQTGGGCCCQYRVGPRERVCCLRLVAMGVAFWLVALRMWCVFDGPSFIAWYSYWHPFIVFIY